MIDTEPSTDADDSASEDTEPKKTPQTPGEKGEPRVKRGNRLNRDLIRSLGKLERHPWALDSMAKLEADMRALLELDPDGFLGPLEGLVPSETK